MLYYFCKVEIQVPKESNSAIKFQLEVLLITRVQRGLGIKHVFFTNKVIKYNKISNFTSHMNSEKVKTKVPTINWMRVHIHLAYHSFFLLST